MKEREVEFIGKIKRELYSREDYKMYAVDVDKEKYPDIKFTIYKNATIAGNLHSLTKEGDYIIKAKEKSGAKGYIYNVVNIKKTKLKSETECYAFLKEILTLNQASELYKHYPNIIDLVVNGEGNSVDLSKLNGIKDFTFGKIKEKIIENYALFDLINEFNGALTISMLKRLYSKYPSIEKIRTEIRCRPYKTLCGLQGIGFIKADSILLELEKNGCVKFEHDLKTSMDRCMACVLYFLEQNESNGSTKMSLIKLRKVAMKLTPACSNHFISCIKEDSLIYLNKKKMEVALKETYDTELLIAANLIPRLSNSNPWNYTPENYKDIDGIELSSEQINFLKSVCCNLLTVLAAPAGTGKSFSTKALINMLKDNKKTFLLAAPTGKAAKKLASYTGERAETIHRILGFKNGRFEYNSGNKLIADVILLDEVGMTDIKLFRNLIEAIPKSTRIVLIGDKFQLNSVGCGALLRDLISTDFIPQVNFTKVFRMGEGGVLTACTNVRNNKIFITEDKKTRIGKDKSYSFIPSSSDDINKKILTLYKGLIEKHEAKDITVLSSYNKGNNGCSSLNQLLQPIANKNSINNNKCVKVQLDKSEAKYYIGDSVIQNSNNYRANLYINGEISDDECLIANGEQGIITDIIENGLVIDFDGIEVYYSYSEIATIKHAFAISVHKMQGSQNKIIIFCCPRSHTYMLSNNIIYTAISRAEKYVFHFAEMKTLNSSIKKSDSEKRSTMLGELLQLKIKEPW